MTDFHSILREIQASPAYADQMVYVRELPACPAQYADPSYALHDSAQRLLAAQGITHLYSHQAAALDALHRGEHALITTGTASGKSLCYLLPILEMLAADPRGTALLLFPLKALCQDQYRQFTSGLAAAEVTALAGVFDGDTPSNTRRKLRDGARAIFTNPDMLHAALLPQHARWAPFLSQLRYLVLDELHVYNGIFGSNMAHLLRRFFRVCAQYGSTPQIITCSATIGNPRELAEELTGFPHTLIDQDGSPRGKRTFVFWNPPQIRNTRSHSRRSANVEAHELMAMLVQHGVRTITFSKAKVTAEMIHRYVTETLQQQAPQLMRALSPYRAGYLPEERREIERRLFSGELLGVSTTRALELGIDIGGLDASILVGYPGTLASFFQQAGRAGRRADDALVLLVGLDTPANQYIMQHPEYLFERPLECAVLEPGNPFVVTGQLRCATQELPLAETEVPLFGANASLVLQILQENQKVRWLDGRWYHAATEIPQHEVSLRSHSDANVVIEDVDTGAIIGQVDKFHSQPLLHPDAIYLHQGETYRVLTLDLERNIARVVKVETDYYTQPIGGTDVHHIDYTLREKPFGAGRVYWGEVTAHFRTVGYEKVRFYELDAFARHGLDFPPFTLETMALWIVPPESLMGEVQAAGLDGFNGLRGIGYATRMLLPLFQTCDTLDFSHSVGCVNAPWQAIFIYERYPHGLGFTEKAYQRLHEILPAVLVAIEQCTCEDGCPNCVGKPLRGELTWNPERGEGAIPSKTAALMILRGLLGDGTRLQEPETQTLTETEDADRQRLERAVRRRLERMREPRIQHPIEQQPATGYPEVEDLAALATPDVARRVERRGDAEKSLRKRLAEKLSAQQGAAPPLVPVTPPPPEVQSPIALGDSLAARARRLKKQRQSDSETRNE